MGHDGAASMMPSSIKKVCSFFKNRICARKIFVVFVTLSDLNKTWNRLVPILLIKCIKTEVFCCKSGMHVRPMRFSILSNPTDGSDKTQLMCSTILLCLFASKYDINGSRLNYSTMTSNKFKYINVQIICKDKAWLVLLSKHLYI